MLGGLGPPQRVVLLEVSDSDGAAAFATDLATGTPRSRDYRGVSVSADRRGLATAEVESFLVLGSRTGVRSVIDAATGEAPSLAGADSATRVRDELPEHHFAEAWVSEQGAEQLIGRSRDQLGTLAPLIEPGNSTGAAAALSADDDGLELAIRSALDPERVKASPGFFSAFGRFAPSLPEQLPDDTLAYLGIGNPQDTINALLAQAKAQAPGIAAGFEGLVRSLRRQGGVDIERELLAALGGEAAFALEPLAGKSLSSGAVPYLEFVAKGVDEVAANQALAALSAPIARGRVRERRRPELLRAADRRRRCEDADDLTDGRAHLRGLRRPRRDRLEPAGDRAPRRRRGRARLGRALRPRHLRVRE